MFVLAHLVQDRFQLRVVVNTVMNLLITQQDRQCTYIRNAEAHSRNRCCRPKAISSTYSACVSGLSYPACNAHAPNCHLLPVWLYNIFPHYLISGKIFGGVGGIIVHKIRGLIFSTTFVRNISYSKKNSARYYHKCMRVFT